jgi:phosphoribosyl 1,2-cyclic phosphodiesterase
VKIRFWGVRGSIPAPGPDTVRYGGNTSCVSVELQSGHLVIVDMGTGLMALGNQLLGRGFGAGGNGHATILLSHAHWDHIQGFGFFAPVFVPGNRFDVYGNAQSSAALEGILEGQMNPHFSPLHTLRNLGASLRFSSVVPGEPFAVGGATVRAAKNPHGGTTSLAFRIDDGDRSIVYASDVGYPDGGASEASLALYRGADILIHDATYTPADQITRRARGYSSWADAARVAAQAAVGRLVLYHYDQDYGDDLVDQVVADCRAELDRLGASSIALTAAREGLEL